MGTTSLEMRMPFSAKISQQVSFKVKNDTLGYIANWRDDLST